jgi:hypothetical protein
MSRITVSVAHDIASRFVLRLQALARSSSRESGDAFRRTVGQCSAVFWWDDRLPLFEFPLYDPASQHSSGYLVVSSDRRLPPILEYSLEGTPLSTNLNAYLAANLVSLSAWPRSVTWYYWSPLEIVAKVELAGDVRTTFLTIPSLEPVRLDSPLPIQRNPNQIWASGPVAQEWRRLEDWPRSAGTLAVKELWDRKPIRYQQGCARYDLDRCSLSDKDGGHYCEPYCIAGCVPVAWGMLTSCWKKIDQNGSNTKIWPSSSCWQLEWPSTTNPNRCQIVSDAIWAYHSVMGTTCNGSTSRSEYLKAAYHLSNSSGLNWDWGKWEDVGFDKCAQIIDAWQPFVFGATGQWSAFLQGQFPGRAFNLQSEGQGKVGHAVVCYGYDTDAQTLKICLGWGSSFADKWIKVSEYADNIVAFVSRFGLQADRTSVQAVADEPAIARVLGDET